MMTLHHDPAGLGQEPTREGEQIRHYLAEARRYLNAIGDALDNIEASQEGGNDGR
jgi:hypothetical protein